MNVFWFLPTHGDGHFLGTSQGARPVSLPYLKQVAARIKEYADLGIESFIFSGYPHLEEAYRFAELVFPLLPEPYASLAGRGVTNLTGPFGEVIANDVLPKAAAG